TSAPKPLPGVTSTEVERGGVLGYGAGRYGGRQDPQRAPTRPCRASGSAVAAEGAPPCRALAPRSRARGEPAAHRVRAPREVCSADGGGDAPAARPEPAEPPGRGAARVAAPPDADRAEPHHGDGLSRGRRRLAGTDAGRPPGQRRTAGAARAQARGRRRRF